MTEEQFRRLAWGQHPTQNHPGTDTPVQLIRVGTATPYRDKNGVMVTPMEHRSYWDACCNSSKSVSVMATKDPEVRIAHRESVGVMLRELEPFTQARVGGSAAPQLTGQFIAATFEHDTARPVDGFVAPQLHTHCLIANVTFTTQDIVKTNERTGKTHILPAGTPRSLQTKAILESQRFATAVYRSELAVRLRALGYEIERGEHGQPEIKGLSADYLKACSPRRAQILEEMESKGLSGAKAAQVAAHSTRDRKSHLPRETVRAQQQELAERFGNQPEHVLERALSRRHAYSHAHQNDRVAKAAVQYATDRGMERSAVIAERDVLTDALRLSMGEATIGPIRQDWARRVEAGEFLERQPFAHKVGRAFTTPDMVALEQQMVQRMLDGRSRDFGPIAKPHMLARTEMEHSHLNDDQRQAFRALMSSTDQIVGLQGFAGVGKTTTLAAVRDAAERNGWTVTGVAPTGTSAEQLREAGIETMTLQRFLGKDVEPDRTYRLHILDESSLSSTEQMTTFLDRMTDRDRVILVGDVRQHQSVDAGKPFEQLQQHGLTTAKLTQIVRQTDPDLLNEVNLLADGRVLPALHSMDARGKIHEIASAPDRFRYIAQEFVKDPAGTRVVNPDNRSRVEINEAIHKALQEARIVSPDQTVVRTLADRSEMTAVDRKHADRYEVGDTLRYNKGSRTVGIAAGEYTTVVATDRASNTLTVERRDGSTLAYDPSRLHGVSVYQAQERSFAAGDRVQFTAPNRELGIVNRAVGTIQHIDAEHISVTLESSKDTITFPIEQHRNFDLGYASTSASSQGMTVRRVILHVDNSRGGEQIGQRLGYVGISRAREDALIVTDSKERLFTKLQEDHSHRLAWEPAHEYSRQI